MNPCNSMFGHFESCERENKPARLILDDIDEIEYPVDGVLDLHMFAPGDAASVANEYLEACREKGIDEVRIIHGKGKGILRETVHALLEKHPYVLDFRLDSGLSSWGVTIARLKKNI